VTKAALNVLKALDKSGRSDCSDTENEDDLPDEAMIKVLPHQLTSGRHASVRDFLKLLSRISHTVMFERNISYATEAQRTLCLAETVDVFAASCPSFDQRKDFITQVAAPNWGITGELALNYIEARQPSVTNGRNYTEIGRAKIPNAPHGRPVDEDTQTFVSTNFSLRLMESIGVCITENESTLLVGETGCGKTSMLQQLAKYAGHELVVQNLSLQTDSTDLLGGYRPLEISHIARKMYLDFVDIFVASFSRKHNADFLKFTASTLEKGEWKKLSQCFTRAAALGMAKVRLGLTWHSPCSYDLTWLVNLAQISERRVDNKIVDASVPGFDAWTKFTKRAEQFERQRMACDSGLAFAFTEGALVDAIRTGKW
jgi:midasin